MRAAVVTEWLAATGNTPATGNRPKVVDEYTITKCTDITGQDAVVIPTAPNEYTVEIVAADDVIAAIELDPEYTVLWTEED